MAEAHHHSRAVTTATAATITIPFSSTDEVPFVTEIAEISPDEFSRLERGELDLPEGWTLENAEDLPRPRAA